MHGTTNDIIKYGGEKSHEDVDKLIKSVFIESQVPGDWKSRILVSIFQ